MEAPALPTPNTLHRALNPVGVLLLTFSALSPVVSVYIYGGGVLHMAGTGAAPAFLLGGIASAILGLAYAELGAAYPQAGGLYPSLIRILGPLAAFPYIVMMMVIAPAAIAFSLLGFADYVRVLVPGLAPMPVALTSLLAASALAVLSIRANALITGAFLSIEGITLIALCALALHPARPLADTFAHPVVLDGGALKPLPVAGLALAVVSAVYATAGCNWAMYFAEEMRDAERRIGGVIALSGPLAALVIAGPLILVAMAAGNLRGVLGADAPVAAFIAQSSGRAVAAAINVGVLLAVFNAIVANILGYSRLLYATGRDGIWPRPLNRLVDRIHGRLRSPWAATIVLGAATAAAMLLGEQPLLVLTGSSYILEFLLIALALLIGRRRGLSGRTWRAPLHPLLPAIALAMVVAFVAADWMDADAGRPSLVFLAAVIVASLVWYRLRPNARIGQPALAATD